MHLSELTYKREQDFENDIEKREYLRTIHNAMADLVFDEHVLSLAYPDLMASGGYIAARDAYFALETYFEDEFGETHHALTYVPEGNELFEARLEDRRKKIEERRAQIRLVE